MGGAPTITVPADSVEEWTVENWTNEVHAFHIHQVHFRVLAVNGRSRADTALLDTVTVPARIPPPMSQQLPRWRRDKYGSNYSSPSLSPATFPFTATSWITRTTA